MGINYAKGALAHSRSLSLAGGTLPWNRARVLRCSGSGSLSYRNRERLRARVYPAAEALCYKAEIEKFPREVIKMCAGWSGEECLSRVSARVCALTSSFVKEAVEIEFPLRANLWVIIKAFARDFLERSLRSGKSAYGNLRDSEIIDSIKR